MSLARIFLMVEGENVRGAFVGEEGLVEAGHFGGGDEVDAQFVVLTVEQLFEQASGQAAPKRPLQRHRALPDEKPHQSYHGARRCSS
jgi:hypothetical protein